MGHKFDGGCYGELREIVCKIEKEHEKLKKQLREREDIKQVLSEDNKEFLDYIVQYCKTEPDHIAYLIFVKVRRFCLGAVAIILILLGLAGYSTFTDIGIKVSSIVKSELPKVVE